MHDNFKRALDYFDSIEGYKENNNPYSPIEKYSSLAIHHRYNDMADFPVIQFDLNQMFRTTGDILYREIINAENVKEICEREVDRKAKNIYAMMYRSGKVYGRYFKK